MQYARKVDFNLKTGKEKELMTIFEGKILPLLQKQKGFQDELVLMTGLQVISISLWDTKQNLEAYDKTTYPKIIEFMKPLIEMTPKVQVCDVAYASHHATV